MPRDKQPWILGISASHNGSACLLRGDEIVVAIQEERLSRFRRQRIFGAGPSLAIDYCLNYAGIDPSALDLVVLCVQGEAQTAPAFAATNNLNSLKFAEAVIEQAGLTEPPYYWCRFNCVTWLAVNKPGKTPRFLLQRSNMFIAHRVPTCFRSVRSGM